MDLKLPRCSQWYKEECLDRTDKIGCNAALAYCAEVIAVPYTKSGKLSVKVAVQLIELMIVGLNPHDMTKPWSVWFSPMLLCLCLTWVLAETKDHPAYATKK